jgi:hypothetical protein
MNNSILERAEVLLKDVSAETKREILNLIREVLKENGGSTSELPASNPEGFRNAFGLWSKDVADEVERLIDEGFERIDPRDWQNSPRF